MRCSADAAAARWCALAVVRSRGSAGRAARASCWPGRAARRSTGSQRSRSREPWRAFSAAAVHYSALHLLANLAGVALVGALGVVARVPAPMAVGLAARLAADAARPAGRSPSCSTTAACRACCTPASRCVAVHLVLRARRARGARSARCILAGACDQGVERNAVGRAAAPSGRAGTSRSRRSRTPAGSSPARSCAAIAAATCSRRRGATAGRLRAAASSIAAMSDRKSHLDAARRRPARRLLLSLGPEPGRGQGGAARDRRALWQAALRSIGAALLVWLWAKGARHRALRARRARCAAACSPARSSPPSSSASSSACSSRPRRAWSSSSTSRPSSSPSACRSIARSERLGALQAGRPRARLRRRRVGVRRRLLAPAAGPMQWLGDALGVARRRALGRDDAGDPRHGARPGLGREDAALPARGLGACCCSPARSSATAPLPHRLSPLAWSSLAFQIVIVSFASYLVWFWLIRHYPATRLASFTMLTPVFGLVLGALLLGRARDRAPAVRAGDGRRRHRPRQPQDDVIGVARDRRRAAAPSARCCRGRSGAGSASPRWWRRRRSSASPSPSR